MTPSEAKASIRAGRHVNAAVVLSGGGAPGICSGVGYLKGLLAAGFDFAELSGTSAGAVATGLFASARSIEECEARLRAIRKDAVVPSWWQELKMHTCGSLVCDESDAALRLLRANVSGDWASLRYPCHWWTSCQGSPSVKPVCASDGGLFQTPAEAIRASMSIPFALPCVQGLDGNRYVDGGLRFNVPIIPDWEDRFDIVFVCINTPEETFRPINKDLTAIQQAKIILDSILEAQNDAAKEHCADDNNLVYFRLPPWPVELNDLIFNFDLIDAAASQVALWMEIP